MSKDPKAQDLEYFPIGKSLDAVESSIPGKFSATVPGTIVGELPKEVSYTEYARVALTRVTKGGTGGEGWKASASPNERMTRALDIARRSAQTLEESIGTDLHEWDDGLDALNESAKALREALDELEEIVGVLRTARIVSGHAGCVHGSPPDLCSICEMILRTARRG